MASSFEKSVKGGTKVKLAAPKSKYVEHILVATHAGEAGVAEIFRALQNRLRDSTWTIVFKSLIIVHYMIREGERDVTLRYLAKHTNKLAISSYSDAQVQGRNIRHYTQYLLERARAYRETKVDYVREGEGRLKRLTVEKGLLRETESVQNQIMALLKCDVLSDDIENEITLTAFRLLVTDLLALYYIMNEGVINLLEHYFEMSRYDAERALEIYKMFSKQTTLVVEYLAVARQFETSTRLEVPKLKHAPTSLTASLEEYLHDPDFEINRRQYLAAQEAKKGRGATNGASKARATASPRSAQKETPPPPKPAQASTAKQPPKGPGPDLIDFFESIEQNQQLMAQPQPPNQHVQQTQQNTQYNQPSQPYQPHGFQTQQGGFPPQQQSQPQQFATTYVQQSSAPINQLTQPPVRHNFETGTYSNYALQTQPGYSSPSTLPGIPQNNVVPFQTPLPQHQQPQQTLSIPGAGQQQTNPFRQSVMPSANASVSYASSPPVSSPAVRTQGTNPFSKGTQVQQTVSNQGSSPFTTPAPTISPVQITPQIQPAQPIRPMPAGTNPFSRTSPPQQQQPTAPPPSTLGPNSAGSTNPFRQSVFHNQQTGANWQQNQGTMGGLEQLHTVPVFPRQGESNGQQQQKWM
ncbi:hypothetical protein FGG08_005132 [Glutinoglossum americanum]|uniref:ENTH domain-containing protein n=1 Tax=Glutinoglossum americanum TaxID=1670608 RepID=A0A9P8L1R0_9PEZI|nr:hypothetical protein FGG08_005132 [Glutinoglossum americanum]